MTDHLPTVRALRAYPTETDTPRGVDVDFTFDDGQEGHCTLLPHEDGSPGYASWGEPSHWLDGSTVERLRHLDWRAHREVCAAIVAACAPLAEEVAPWAR